MKKIIHVGLDVHQRSIAIEQLNDDRREPQVLEIPNSPAILRRTFLALKKQGGFATRRRH